MEEHTAERNPRFLRLLQMVRALSVRRTGISASEMARLTGERPRRCFAREPRCWTEADHRPEP